MNYLIFSQIWFLLTFDKIVGHRIAFEVHARTKGRTSAILMNKIRIHLSLEEVVQDHRQVLRWCNIRVMNSSKHIGKKIKSNADTMDTFSIISVWIVCKYFLKSGSWKASVWYPDSDCDNCRAEYKVKPPTICTETLLKKRAALRLEPVYD